MRAGCEMADRRLWHRCYRACYRAWERVGIGHLRCRTRQHRRRQLRLEDAEGIGCSIGCARAPYIRRRL